MKQKEKNEMLKDGRVGKLFKNLHSCFLATASMRYGRSREHVEDPGLSFMQNTQKHSFIFLASCLQTLFFNPDCRFSTGFEFLVADDRRKAFDEKLAFN